MKKMTDENALKLGRAVATLRERIGLSQKELAQRAGITPSHLSRIESGDRMPGKEIIARLAEALYTPGLFLVAGLLVPEEIKSKYNLSDFTVPDIFPGNVRQPAEPLKSVCDVLLANMGLLFEETKRLQEKIKGLEIAAEAIQKLLRKHLEEISPEKIRENLINITPEKWVRSGLFYEWLSSHKHSLEEKIKLMEENKGEWHLQILQRLEAEKTLAEVRGKITGITEAYEMTLREAEKDTVSFLCTFTGLDFNSAEIVAELIRVMKEKKGLRRTTEAPADTGE
ncbi:MAG: helix-turn-helix domain-containing protein [Firmicutes bacterium]|nr:helix-turn-helix domain-containing protein [Bacillota bacterium]